MPLHRGIHPHEGVDHTEEDKPPLLVDDRCPEPERFRDEAKDGAPNLLEPDEVQTHQREYGHADIADQIDCLHGCFFQMNLSSAWGYEYITDS